jgi:hypothetical protein
VHAAWLHNALGNRLARAEPGFPTDSTIDRDEARRLGFADGSSYAFKSAKALDSVYGYVSAFRFTTREQRLDAMPSARNRFERISLECFFELDRDGVAAELGRVADAVGRGEEHEHRILEEVVQTYMRLFQVAATGALPEPWPAAPTASSPTPHAKVRGGELHMWWGPEDTPVLELEALELASEHRLEHPSPVFADSNERMERIRRSHEQERRAIEKIDWDAGHRQLLVAIARILKDLERDFSCTSHLGEDVELTRRMWRWRGQDSVRLTPDAPGAGAIVVVYSRHGGFILRLGRFYEKVYGGISHSPPEQQIHDLETEVRDYVEGRFTEFVDVNWVAYEFEGRHSGGDRRRVPDDLSGKLPMEVHWQSWGPRTD